MFLVGGDDYSVRANSKRASFDQSNAEHGLKNDVWRLRAPEGETWFVQTDKLDRTPYDHKMPVQKSLLRWELMSGGRTPSAGQTYEEFIQCQELYPQKFPWVMGVGWVRSAAPEACDPRDKDWDLAPGRRGWFSQRRGHQVAVYQDRLFVVGGRAREHARLERTRSVGGIIDARPQQDTFATWRETVTLKNDVWMSADWGESWKLIQPGCKSNQLELLLRDRESTPAHEKLAQMRDPSLRCVEDSDCYGIQEECNEGVCVCRIWSPREQHRVAVWGGYMYLVGGFTSRHLSYCAGEACGDLDAGAYREYMPDVWYSKLVDVDEGTAGGTWLPLPTGAAFSGRGGHSLAIMKLLNYNPVAGGSGFALFVLGGRTGCSGADDAPADSQNLNDVWFAELPEPRTDPVALVQNGWKRAFEHAEWSPRSGHAVVVDVPSAINGYTQRVYVIGGESDEGELLDDTWSWGWECVAGADGALYVDGLCEASSVGGGTLVNGSKWRQDYEDEAFFRYSSGADFVYAAGPPQRYYVSPESNVEALSKVYLPLGETAESSAEEQGYPSMFLGLEGKALYGSVPRRVPLIDERRLAMLQQVGIRTVRELAEASSDVILKLRGYPADLDIFDDASSAYEDVCDHRALAIALLLKCEVDPVNHPLTNSYSEGKMPWNVVPDFQGDTPVGKGKSSWRARWHGKWFNVSADADDEQLIQDWDGCSPLTGGMDPVDVPGIGDVPVPFAIRDPRREVSELVCRANPGARAYHAGAYFNQKVFVMGGLTDAANMSSAQDTWYRDDRLPRATLTQVPAELDWGGAFGVFQQPEYEFDARPDKEGTIFEYMLYDADEHDTVRYWDKTLGRANVNWLDEWYEQGPGTGTYIFYIRSIDPAGNVDITYYKRNMYKWKYNTALPWWPHIWGSIMAFVFVCYVCYMEYKRRKKKAAMERYAIKRMRRKFKGAQKDLKNKAGNVDWKKMAKEDKKKKSKGKGDKKTGKSKEKKDKDREKHKMKQKEKEKLKKKKE